MTNSPINLNKFRKAKKRAEKIARAEENRVKFGRTKAEREAAKKETRRSQGKLDGKKLD